MKDKHNRWGLLYLLGTKSPNPCQNQQGIKMIIFTSFRILIILISFSFLIVSAKTVKAQDSHAANGKAVYEKYCVGCHGERYDGNGPAAVNLLIKPRDLTLGVFKFKSTEIGSMPTNDDLKKTLTYGLSPSSMPSFALMPDAEKDDIIAFIKTLSPKWKTNYSTKQYLVPSIPDFVGTKTSIESGKTIFNEKCAMCHGVDGKRGDVIFHLKWSDKSPDDITRPADFSYKIKRGPKVEDIFLSMTAGVEGTPMISFSEMISEQDRWNLTSYILSLMGKERR